MKAAFFVLTLFLGCLAQAQDVLLQKSFSLKTDSVDITIKERTEENIKAFVDNFDVRLDSKAKIVSPKEVLGSLTRPVLKVSIRKCVLLICQTVDLDAEFSLQVVQGSCDFNYRLIVDLQRSSRLLSDLYSHINTDICVKRNTTGANAALKVYLVRGAHYSSGIVQRQAYGLISLQGESLLESFVRVMKANGVTEVTALK